VISGPDWIDPEIVDMPLRDWKAVAVKGMRVAVHTTNGIMPARADIGATVMYARALADAGAIVEEAIPTGIGQCLEIFLGIANADGGAGLRAALAMAGTEHLHPLMETALAMAAVHQPAGVLQSVWVRVDLYRSAMLSFLKNNDLILSPVNALPAIEHGTCFHPDVLPAFSYTIAHNLTGWPGAVVRCGISAEGLPIGVQAVARPWREDVALAAVQLLEAALDGYQRPLRNRRAASGRVRAPPSARLAALS
jgi:amidase